MASHGMYTALSGAIGAQQSLDVLSNNMANVNTTGFRGDRVAFQEQLVGAQATTSANRQVAVSEVQVDDGPGAVRQTDNPLDLALQGEGMFTVQAPNGPRYTRGGALLMDRDGTLRTHSGHALLDTRGQVLTIPPETREIQIARDGTVHADQQEIGQIRIVRFQSPRDIVKEGATLFAAAPGIQPSDDTTTTVAQGYLESSNVNAIAGMNELINNARSFDVFQKLLKTFQEVDQKSASMIARQG